MIRLMAVKVRSSSPARWSPERLLLRSKVVVENPAMTEVSLRELRVAGGGRPRRSSERESRAAYPARQHLQKCAGERSTGGVMRAQAATGRRRGAGNATRGRERAGRDPQQVASNVAKASHPGPATMVRICSQCEAGAGAVQEMADCSDGDERDGCRLVPPSCLRRRAECRPGIPCRRLRALPSCSLPRQIERSAPSMPREPEALFLSLSLWTGEARPAMRTS